MFKPGSRVKCIRSQDGVYINVNEVCEVLDQSDCQPNQLDLCVLSKSGVQYCNSNYFMEVDQDG